MKRHWLYTTAIALTIGVGAAFAQAPDQRRDDSPRAQGNAQGKAAQSREMDRPAAADRAKQQTTQPEQRGGGRDRERSEGASPADRSKQAQEPRERDREPTRQSREDRERSPATSAQEKQQGHDARQSTDQQRGRDSQKGERAQDSNRPADTKRTTEQERGREGQKDERARDERRPADAKQQESLQQQERDRQERDRRDQAGQRTEPSKQQSERDRRDQAGQRQGDRTDQTTDRTNRRTDINDDQRRQIVDQLRRDRTVTNTNVNVRVGVGERLPRDVQARRLPPDIVRIAPQYRDYEYTMIDNRIAIVDPGSYEVVDILDDGPDYRYGRSASYGRERFTFSGEERTRLRELARRSSSTTVGSTAPSGGSTCLSLQPVPEEMARNHPELSSYRYLAIGDEVVLIDPKEQKIVQVID
jgi:Protein of unknown function (DUF1236)